MLQARAVVAINDARHETVLLLRNSRDPHESGRRLPLDPTLRRSSHCRCGITSIGTSSKFPNVQSTGQSLSRERGERPASRERIEFTVV